MVVDLDRLRADLALEAPLVERGVLHLPAGDLRVHQIGKGTFSTAFEGEDGRVYVVSPEDVPDKAVAQAVRQRVGGPHVPDFRRICNKCSQVVYVAPRYRTPLRREDSKDAWADYRILWDCAGPEPTLPITGARENRRILRCAEEMGLQQPLLEALHALADEAARVSNSYLFEFGRRNLATDAQGNLVLLDVLFDLRSPMRA